MTFDPGNCVQQYVQQFKGRFLLRYSTLAAERNLSFYEGPLTEAFNSAMIERKLLAVYLHADNECGRVLFPTRILLDQSICRTLNQDFVLFPWDCSSVHGCILIQNELNQLLELRENTKVTYCVEMASLPCILLVGIDSDLNVKIYEQIEFASETSVLSNLRFNIEQFSSQIETGVDFKGKL